MAPFVDPMYDHPKVLLHVDFIHNLKLSLTNKCLYTCQTNTQQRHAGMATHALQLAHLAQSGNASGWQSDEDQSSHLKDQCVQNLPVQLVIY